MNYAHYLFLKSQRNKKLRRAKEQKRIKKKSTKVKMDQLDYLIEGSVKEHYEKRAETKNELDYNLNKENQSNDQVKIRKRKKNDESTDEDELPRKRVVFMGQQKRNNRVVSKYQKELNQEREREKFFAEVFNEEYSDSLKDFVVNDKSELVEDEMTSYSDVYTTSSFLKDRASLFIDDEAEEDSEIEVKDDFSDSEEEQMYHDAKGVKNDFYDDDDDFSSEGDADDEELFSDSDGFERNVHRKRDQFVFDECEVEGEDLGEEDSDDLGNEDDNGSDLDSFITDNDEPTILDDTIEEDLNSSMFFKAKKGKRIPKLISDSEDNENQETIESSSSLNKSSSKVLSNITFKSANNSPIKQALSTKCNQTINLDSDNSLTCNAMNVDENYLSSDNSDEIIKERKKKKSTILIESEDESEPNVTDLLSDLLSESVNDEPDEISKEITYDQTNTTEQTNTTGRTSTNEETGERTASTNEQDSEKINRSNDSKISSPKDDHLNESKFDSDSTNDSLNDLKFIHKSKNQKKPKIIESDSSSEEDQILVSSQSSMAKNKKENESVECVFSEEEDYDDFELSEADLEDTLN